MAFLFRAIKLVCMFFAVIEFKTQIPSECPFKSYNTSCAKDWSEGRALETRANVQWGTYTPGPCHFLMHKQKQSMDSKL